MLRIITDTGGDVTYLGAPEIGMEAVELAVQFEEFPYDYRNDTDFTVFYETLEKSKKLPTTSQPTPAQYLDIFEDTKEKGDEVLVLTISAGISGVYVECVAETTLFRLETGGCNEHARLTLRCVESVDGVS